MNGYPKEQKGFKVTLHPERVFLPLTKWKNKSMKFFLCSMGDIFHKDVPDDFLEKVFLMMCEATQHTFQVLTKRPERMKDFVDWFVKMHNALCPFGVLPGHIWLGTSVENQQAAEWRIPFLLNTPTAVRFLSCEPLLGPVDLEPALFHPVWNEPGEDGLSDLVLKPRSEIHQVIVGGESGPRARPMHPNWARKLREQCLEAGIAYFFKQWGAWLPGSKIKLSEEITYGIYQMQNGTYGRIITAHRWDEETVSVKVGKKKAGRMLDGQEWNQFPDEIKSKKCGECSCR